MFFDYDPYKAEYEQFQWDVHMLIEGTLDASIHFLDTEWKAELAKIEACMNKLGSDEYQSHLVDKHVDTLATNGAQERFLRNMALVVLASRLEHSLKKMAKSAIFSPRDTSYKGEGEFKRLWAEYDKRFGIDCDKNARTAFVGILLEVRNKIVHDGSDANIKRGRLDTEFSKRYPEYVYSEGILSEVSVTKELLEKNIAAAIELVAWLADELRKRELANEKDISTIQ